MSATGSLFVSRLRDPFRTRRFGIGWWSASGLSAAASAGANELKKRDKNVVIYDSPRYGVTVVIARGNRARQLHAWFNRDVTRTATGTKP